MTSSLKRQWFAPLLGFFLGIAVYSPCLLSDFTWDDRAAVLQNPDMDTAASWRGIFLHDFWGQPMNVPDSHKSYRPLTTLSLKVNAHAAALMGNKKLLHERPLGFKATNLGIYALTCSLAGILATRILPSNQQLAIMTTTALFSIHPVHVEAIAPAVGRADLLCCIFTVACLIIRLSPQGSTPPAYIIALMLAIAAVSSKEIGISAFVLLFVVDCCDLFYGMKGMKNGMTIQYKSRSWITFTTFQLLSPLMLGTGWIVFHIWMHGGAPLRKWDAVENDIDGMADFGQRVMSYANTHWLYAWKLVWPMQLCHDWSMKCIPHVTSILDIRNFRSMTLYLITAAAVALSLRINSKSAILSLSLLIFPFLPAAQIAFPIGTVLAERLLLLPSLGLCMLVGCSLSVIMQRGSKSYITRLVRLLVCEIIIFWMLRSVNRSWRRCWDWYSERELFVSGIEVCPDGVKSLNNLAVLMLNKDEAASAEKLLDHALSIHENYSTGVYNRALVYLITEDYNSATKMLERALILDPTNNKARVYLAHVLLLMSSSRPPPLLNNNHYRHVKYEEGSNSIKHDSQQLEKSLTLAEHHIDDAIQVGTSLSLAALVKTRCMAYHGIRNATAAAYWYLEALGANIRLRSDKGMPSSDLLDEDYVWQEYFELESKYDDNDFPREKAMKLCKSAVASPLQNDFTVLVNCGSLFDRAGMPNDALRLYEDALAIDKNNPYLLNNIGWILETRLGDIEGAMNKYTLAVDLLKPEMNPQIEANVQNLRARMMTMTCSAASNGNNSILMT